MDTAATTTLEGLARGVLAAGSGLALAWYAGRDGEVLPVSAPIQPGGLELLARALAEHSERLERIEAVLLADRADLERRLGYALGELRRRDELEVQRQLRPWWRRLG